MNLPTRQHSQCSFLATNDRSSSQSDQIRSKQFTATRVRDKVDNVTSVIVSNASIWPVSKPFKVLESTGSCHSTNTNRQTILADRATITSGCWGLSGIPCLIKLLDVPKLLRRSFAMWLVPSLFTATLFSLVWLIRNSPNCSEYRTCWRASYCVVKCLNTLCQLWKSFTGYRFSIMSRLKQQFWYTWWRTQVNSCRNTNPFALFILFKKLVRKCAIGTVLAFCDSAVSVWNNLPENIHVAKTAAYTNSVRMNNAHKLCIYLLTKNLLTYILTYLLT